MEEQAGFRSGRGCEEQILRCHVCGSRNTSDKVYNIQKITGSRVCRGKASVLKAKEAK